jgi:DNA-directed RNA polymerase subunit M/transcription elongation factor TFIIS
MNYHDIISSKTDGKVSPLATYFYTTEPYTLLCRRNLVMSINANISPCPTFKNLESKKQVDLLTNCEKIIYNMTIEYISKTNNLLNWSDHLFKKTYAYTGKVFCVKYDYQVNPGLVENLILGRVPNGEIYRYIREGDDDIKVKSIINSQMEVETKQVASTMFKCPRCNRRETHHVDIQMRAADEDSTSNITCLYCNYTWRM